MDFWIPSQVQTALTLLEEAGREAYLVGGCVRDTLLGRRPADYDLCTSALPKETARCFSAYPCIATGLKHGTLTVCIDGMQLEITTYRLDGGYSDSRHPDGVTFTPCLEEDLARRDFTVNAMAYHPQRGLVDLYGGQRDLTARLIRCVGEPERRYLEDALRILRAYRFVSKLDFGLENQTGRWAQRLADQLAKVSRERIYGELRGILRGPAAGRAVLEMGPQILGQIFPSAAGFPEGKYGGDSQSDRLRETAEAIGRTEGDFSLRCALLLGLFYPQESLTDDFGREKAAQELWSLLKGRCFPTETAEEIAALYRFGGRRLLAERTSLLRLLREAGPQTVERLLAFRQAQPSAGQAESGDAQPEAVRQRLSQLLAGEKNACYALNQLAIGGRELLAAGFPPGPSLGGILRRLLEAVIDGEVENSPEALLAFLGSERP